MPQGYWELYPQISLIFYEETSIIHGQWSIYSTTDEKLKHTRSQKQTDRK